jgi:hypothetical protein
MRMAPLEIACDRAIVIGAHPDEDVGWKIARAMQHHEKSFTLRGCGRGALALRHRFTLA